VELDGRQSPTALSIQRGLARLLAQHDHSFLYEFTLASGRRADVIALSPQGHLWIIEIKSSKEDYLTDNKWHEYRDYCDYFSFAIPQNMDQTLIHIEAGLIVADSYGAEMLRPPSNHPLYAARRKSITQHFARTASQRLQALRDQIVL
jgi:hypothetical protein